MAANGSLRADYGIDAPGVVMVLVGVGVGILVVVGAVAIWARPTSVVVVIGLWLAGAYGAMFLSMGAYMVYWSKVGKVRGREAALDMVPWSGSEAVLDVGCGRGLLLIGAAKRAREGRVVGIDIWQVKDQSGNCREATLANARLEGVDGRVSVETGDMRELPFGDETFDRVVSHWAVHNLATAEERSRAIREMVRVLRPGGYLVLADIQFRKEYAAELAALGMGEIRQSVHGVRDAILGVATRGQFRPGAMCGRKADSGKEGNGEKGRLGDKAAR